MSEETQGLANARQTRDLVLTEALRIAGRAILHVDGHADDGVRSVVIEEVIPAGGYEWELRAAYGRGHTFIRVDGSPSMGDGPQVITSAEELREVMAGDSAKFTCCLPRAWVELALRAADAADVIG